MRGRGRKIAHAHLRHMNPFPADLGDVVRRYPKIFVPEINLGQLSRLIRAEYLVDARELREDVRRPVPRRRSRTSRSWR